MVIKNILVVFGLNLRTILARIKLFRYKHSLILTTEINRDLKQVEGVKKLFNILPKEIEIIDTNNVLIHNKIINLKTIFSKDLNKQDYLQLYTLHYLNFQYTDTKIPDNLVKEILESKISSQPFIESMQLFNIVFDDKLPLKIDERTILKKYNSLSKNVEYHVDGNHVIENLISLTTIEIKFLNKNFPTLRKLIKELKRQSFMNFHAEYNLKYAKDLCVKLEMISIVLDFYKIRTIDTVKLNDIISNWKKTLFEFSNNLILHDNIDGDDLKISIANYKSLSNFKEIKPLKVFTSIPSRGIRGHAFDGKIAYPFSNLYKAFGTITYASGLKRNYERLRSNNCQVYVKKADISHIFHLSFRSVIILPYKIKINNSIDIIEMLITNKSLIFLKYKVELLKDKIVISSKRNIKIDLFVDDHDLNNSKTQKTLNSNISLVKKSLRASKINKLKRTNRIILEGKTIKIFI